MNETVNLTPVFQAIIALIFALITTFLIPWIKSKTTAAQRQNTSDIIKVLVSAAEQLFSAPNMGKEKLAYVADALKKMGYSINIDDVTDELRIQIEAAVEGLPDKKTE